MSKLGSSSSSNKPYYSGNVIINGQKVASNYKKGNSVYSSYNMNDNEKALYDYLGQTLALNVPNVNVFSDDVRQQLQDQIGAYTNQGVNLINSMYTPMLNSLKTDIANRFGNFDNSVFMDNLSGIESKRADSMSSLAQDILAKQNELVNDELSKRYDYLDFASGLQNQIDSRILDYLGLAAQNSSMGNAYSNASRSASGSGFNTSALLSNLVKNAINTANPASGTGLSILGSLFK